MLRKRITPYPPSHPHVVVDGTEELRILWNVVWGHNSPQELAFCEAQRQTPREMWPRYKHDYPLQIGQYFPE